MRALLDVNVLIALLDGSHASHHTAAAWYAEHAKHGWASCPITQNGCLRIMSSAAYPNARSLASVVERLSEATSQPTHEFWADDISILNAKELRTADMLNGKHLTDVYLLALAVRHGGRLVTFDRSVPRHVVRGAADRHLLVL